MIIKAVTKTKKGYIVYFYNGKCLNLISDTDSSKGVCYWEEYWGINDDDFETGIVQGNRMINWFDLPVIIQAQIEKVIKLQD